MIDSIFAWLCSYEFSFWHLPLWFFASVIYYFLWDLVIDHYKPYPWCALCDVMLNNVSYQLHIHPFDYQGIYDELSKNEQELRFS